MAKVFISLGSNIEKERYVIEGLNALKAYFGQLEVSSLYECEAVGFDGDEFYNLVLSFSTEHTIDELADILRQIEFEHGRDLQAMKNTPRTLDLDILLYDDVICDAPVQLPRKEITYNAFVLWPLSEIAGNLHHPVINRTYDQLWAEYDKNSQKIKKQKLMWSN